MRLFFAFVFSACFDFNAGYKILCVFPFASPSHYFLGNELAKGLVEAGHDVTMLTVFAEKNPPTNGKYKQIVMEDSAEMQKEIFSKLTNLSSTDESSTAKFFSNPFKMVTSFPKIGQKVTEGALKNDKMQRLIKSGEKFDVMIIPHFMTEALKALAPHFGAHLILFNNNAMITWMGHFIGCPSVPSINPEIVLGYIGAMNFQQRLVNTAMKIVTSTVYFFYDYPVHQKLVEKYISDKIRLEDVQYNISLVLSNSHVSLNRPQITMPNVIEIAGFHVKPPKKLPHDLQKYLDDSPNGVIYFSMGSNLKGADLPEKTRIDLMIAFSKRKEKILWKFESDKMPGKPANVRIEKWLPQSDVLAHPNVKLFITHGGFLSTIETLYHGVPTVAIPVFGDQLNNAKSAAADGYTYILEYKNLNEETITKAIDEVLNNKKYTENAKYRSKVFHDRQVKPMQEAIYWVEYVAKHNGAHHLKVDYLELKWYQIYMLDIILVIFSVIFIVIYVSLKIIRCILGICFGRKVNGDNVDKNKSKKVKKQ